MPVTKTVTLLIKNRVLYSKYWAEKLAKQKAGS
jgi:hypothetical protein